MFDIEDGTPCTWIASPPICTAPNATATAATPDGFIKAKGLLEKYGKSIEEMKGYRKEIHNERNDVVLFCAGTKVIMLSEKNIDLEDLELNEFLVTYKRQAGNESLEIELGQGMKTFEY